MMGRRTGVGQNVGERAQLGGHRVDGDPPGLVPGNSTSQEPPGGSSVLQLGAPPSVAPSQACFFESSVAPAAPGSVGPQSQHRHTHVSALWWQEPRERDTVWGPNRKQQMGSCQLRNDSKRRDRKQCLWGGRKGSSDRGGCGNFVYREFPCRSSHLPE